MDSWSSPRWLTMRGFMRVRFACSAPTNQDEAVYFNLSLDDGERPTLAVWRSGGATAPLDCVVEESEDGVCWAEASGVVRIDDA